MHPRAARIDDGPGGEPRINLNTLAMHESGGWLAAAAPADARRFRVADPYVAHSLREAGAALVDDRADVEIGSLDDISGDARCAIVGLNLNIPDRHALASRAVRRLARSAEVRVRAAYVQQALRRRGYKYVRALHWDRDQPIRLPGFDSAPPRNAAERYPRRIVVVGHRGEPAPTAFQQALSAVRSRFGEEQQIVRPIVASGSLIVVLNDTVLRVAVGPASRALHIQADAFETLHAVDAEIVSTRVPALLALGQAGLARWSLERRLPGDPAPPAPHQSLLNECVDFLVALYGVRTDRPSLASTSAVQQADLLAAFVPEQARTLAELGSRIDGAVGDLRSGFGHGDFWPSNLLVRDRRLLAVIDWEQAGPRRLPLLDLLHFRLLVTSRPQAHQWGSAFTDFLMPLGRRGPDALTRDYLRRAGVDVTHRQLKHLVAAYWLDFASRQLSTFFDRQGDPLWIDRNVRQVAVPLLAMICGQA